MKQIFAFETAEETRRYQEVTNRLMEKMRPYQRFLEQHFALNEPPKAILWTSQELATTFFSEVPLPAYTNERMIVMSPDTEEWRILFLNQLEDRELPEIRRFYEEDLEESLLDILAHELTHHSDVFLEGFDKEQEGGIWFEEGMCFYLPRKYALSEEQFVKITKVETALASAFEDKYGGHSLENFGSQTYEGNLTSIMYDYWRSYLAVFDLAENYAEGDPKKVFAVYHQWDKEGRKSPLSNYFDLWKTRIRNEE